ncbi:MAG TPA: carboxypeptidase-like regulatory domain-containing protein [Terriglobales bacterium]|jgi:hypothetical protein|nr:carboxypeptidase-like regulatory domain-containing protein [Terriglobales bacterium]
MRRALLLWLVAGSLLSAQQASTPSATVSGQVVQEPGGTPIAKVTVLLAPTNGEIAPGSRFVERLGKTAVTDSEGRFHFTSVPAGEFRVFLQKNGFLSAGRKSQQDSPTYVTVSAGQSVDGLLFRVLPAGVIRGKIVDEDGSALPGVQVSALPASGHGVAGTGVTNDVGEYRIPALTAGSYVVVARDDRAVPDQHDAEDPSSAIYAPTFFPGTMDRGQAATVEVKAGEEMDAGFALSTSRTFTVHGQVSTIATSPRTGVPETLWLQRTDGAPGRVLETALQPDGSFAFDGVLPGPYRIEGRTENGEWWKPVSGTDVVEVSSDVEGLRLAPQPAGEVQGQFRMDNDKPFRWSQLTVALEGEDVQLGGALSAQVNRDGSFRIQNVPAGNYHVVVTADSNNLRDYIMKEINMNGKDVGDSGFAVGPGVSTIDIVASANGSAILGTLVDHENKTVADMQVVCIPDEARRKRHDVYQQERTNSRGQFSFLGLNPGEYLIFALNGEDPAEITDPDFIRQHEATAQKIHLDEGERKTVTLDFSWNAEP